MHRNTNPNLEVLERAVECLGPIADAMVFLGGCATGCLLTDDAAPPIRVTQDVDAITEVASLVDYYRLSDQLRERGFKEDQSDGAPVCRWVANGIVLDVMPTRPDVLGFGNEWYQPALDSAWTFELPSGKYIRIVTGPYFLATKLAAFDDRGNADYVASYDLEDIIAMLDGRPDIVNEVLQADEKLRQHLAVRFSALLGGMNFVAALPGHFPGDPASQARVPLVMERMTAISEIR